MPIDTEEIKRCRIRLVKKQDWLDCRRHIEALDNLFKECSDDEEARMLLELVSRFVCPDDETFNTFYMNQAKNIVDDGAIKVDNCIIGPTTDDEKPDSSQHMCNIFRNLLRRNGGGHFVTGHFHYVETFIEDTKERNIKVIILDDFIGSGETMVDKIVECKELVTRNEYTEGAQFKVISFAAMEKGKQYIEDQGVEVIADCILKKGITDFFNGLNLSAARSNMLKLESLILEPSDHKYSFGYEQSEALYTKVITRTTDPITLETDICLDRAQDNVFPIFWWNTYINREPRKTLLYRY
jgi:hypothetical protein